MKDLRLLNIYSYRQEHTADHAPVFSVHRAGKYRHVISCVFPNSRSPNFEVSKMKQ